MAGEDGFAPVQVGDGAADLQHTVVCARRQPQLLKSRLEQPMAFFFHGAELAQPVGRDAGVAGDSGSAEPLVLDRARRVDPRADGGGALRLFVRIQLLELDRRHFDVQVQPVEQRAGNAREVPGDRLRRADAVPGRVAEVPAGARVHRRDEHRGAGVGDRSPHAGDGDPAVFDGLAQDLHRGAREFRQLVQKQHAVVRERDFAGARDAAAPGQPGGGNGVVRRAERPRADQRGARREDPRDGVNLRRLDGLLKRHLGQDGGQPPREHAFAGAGRADEQYFIVHYPAGTNPVNKPLLTGVIIPAPS